jgi:hypothetical protein
VAGVTEIRADPRSAAPHQGVGRGRFGLPAYSWRVWLGWIALVASIGALALMGWRTDPSDDEVAQTMAIVFWIFGLLSTAGYFELVNKRLWRSIGVTQKSEGLSLAVAALGLGTLVPTIGSPFALILAVLAWRRIRKAGTPIAEGAATAAVAFFAGAVGSVYFVLMLAGVASW